MSARGLIPDTFVQEVLSRTDIVDVVSRHVALKRGGANLLGLCPFHGEKSPSFTVSPTKQFYHCFGCGAHGDAIGFLIQRAGLPFVDAVRELAQAAGLQIPQIRQTEQEQQREAQAREQRSRLTEVLSRAAGHFQEQLRANPRAVDYLKRRGLDGRVAKRFELGYAPDGWRTLAGVFPRYDDPVLGEAGLVVTQGEDTDNPKRYDRFRDRIMFPIRSVKGEVIGFGGRVIDQGEPKYLNSPETPLFVKGRELYGQYENRAGVRERGFALVVEGYMDVVALAQHGVANALATLGTACTDEHVRKLLRFTDHVVFSFDGDAAGRRAAARALQVVLPHVGDLRSFRFLFLPDEHDPDSFIRERGAQAFDEALTGAIPLSRQFCLQAAEGCDLESAEGRARFLAQARPLWESMAACALREQMLQEIATTGRLAATELLKLWQRGGGPSRPARTGPGEAVRPQRPAGRIPAGATRMPVRRPQDHVVRLLLADSSLWTRLSPDDHELLMSLPDWHGLLMRWLERCLMESGPLAWPELRLGLEGEAFGAQARDLMEAGPIPPRPDLEELLHAVAQARRSREQAAALQLLGRA